MTAGLGSLAAAALAAVGAEPAPCTRPWSSPRRATGRILSAALGGDDVKEAGGSRPGTHVG